MAKNKTLKLFNGRGHGKYNNGYLYVAAYSIAECVRLINESCDAYINANEINVYFSKGLWGNAMDGIIPTEPCVYVQKRYSSNSKPVRIL